MRLGIAALPARARAGPSPTTTLVPGWRDCEERLDILLDRDAADIELDRAAAARRTPDAARRRGGNARDRPRGPNGGRCVEAVLDAALRAIDGVEARIACAGAWNQRI